MADTDLDARWSARGDALLRGARAAGEPAVSGGRLYQFGVDPAFVTPCVLAFDDRIEHVDASVTIVGSTGVEFSDAALVTAGAVPTVRGWSAALVGRPPIGPRADWRDGIVCFVRITARERLATLWVDNPGPDHHPEIAAVLAEVADVALRTFAREPVRSYLAHALRPLLVRRHRQT